jgi:hypothetical protein
LLSFIIFLRSNKWGDQKASACILTAASLGDSMMTGFEMGERKEFVGEAMKGTYVLLLFFFSIFHHYYYVPRLHLPPFPFFVTLSNTCTIEILTKRASSVMTREVFFLIISISISISVYLSIHISYCLVMSLLSRGNFLNVVVYFFSPRFFNDPPCSNVGFETIFSSFSPSPRLMLDLFFICFSSFPPLWEVSKRM